MVISFRYYQLLVLVWWEPSVLHSSRGVLLQSSVEFRLVLRPTRSREHTFGWPRECRGSTSKYGSAVLPSIRRSHVRMVCTMAAGELGGTLLTRHVVFQSGWRCHRMLPVVQSSEKLVTEGWRSNADVLVSVCVPSPVLRLSERATMGVQHCRVLFAMLCFVGTYVEFYVRELKFVLTVGALFSGRVRGGRVKKRGRVWPAKLTA